MGSKQSGNQTVTQTPDALTQEWRRQVFGMGLGALGMPGIAGQAPRGMWDALRGGGVGSITPTGPQLQPVPGLDPASREAMENFRRMAQGGGLGFNALSGDQGAISQLMNPYLSNVIDATKGQYGDLAALTSRSVADRATQAGAFGGSRHGVAEGVALGELGKGMGQQLAGLQYQGFGDAMQRAQAMANLGLGASGQLASLGDYARQVQMSQDPAMRNLQIMQGLLSGMPMGMSTTQPTYTNPLGSLLGIGSVLGGLGWSPFGGGGK